ncbi:MAG: flagellar hook-length control protein FliK [Lachnospiraceae bacterium]
MNLQNGIFDKSNITDASSVSKTWNSYRPSKNVDSSQISLNRGQTIQGKIISRDGEVVKIQLEQGQTIQAKLEGTAQLKPGMSVTFSVQSSDSSVVTLAPLYTNLAGDDTATKALQSSGLPVNEKTLGMTNAMILEGMRIDSNSLSAMFQKVSSFPSQSVNALVQMQRMGIEINPLNLEQFEAFQNYEKQITDGMHAIMEGVHSLYDEMLGTDSPGANKFMSAVLDSVLRFADFKEGNNGETWNVAGNGQESVKQMVSSSENIADAFVADGDGTGEGTLANAEISKFLSGVGKGVYNTTAEAVANEPGSTFTGTTADTVANEPGSTFTGITPGEHLSISGKDVWQKMSFGEKADFLQLLKSMGISDGDEAMLRDPESTSRQVLKLISDLNNKDHAVMGKLFGNAIFRNLLNGEMTKNWTLQPSQVADKQNVESLYQRMNQQVKDFTSMLSELAKPESMLGQSLSHMNQNLDFMNQMNQVFPYIQLPLKMNGTDTTGDLFVYTDKKSLAEKEGNVSALLHLDMENLGPMDIYASISDNRKVSTKFMLPNEETLALVERNISLLSNRLEKKGYHMHTEITMEDNKEKVVGTGTIPKPAVTTKNVIARYSFDAKA